MKKYLLILLTLTACLDDNESPIGEFAKRSPLHQVKENEDLCVFQNNLDHPVQLVNVKVFARQDFAGAINLHLITRDLSSKNNTVTPDNGEKTSKLPQLAPSMRGFSAGSDIQVGGGSVLRIVSDYGALYKDKFPMLLDSKKEFALTIYDSLAAKGTFVSCEFDWND